MADFGFSLMVGWYTGHQAISSRTFCVIKGIQVVFGLVGVFVALLGTFFVFSEAVCKLFGRQATQQSERFVHAENPVVGEDSHAESSEPKATVTDVCLSWISSIGEAPLPGAKDSI